MVGTMSHPTWVRGLKRALHSWLATSEQSHPTWVRGLKRGNATQWYSCRGVAPYVGAWIETKFGY